MIFVERRFIYAQDIMLLTGRSKSYAYENLRRVRRHFGKNKHQLVSFQEFAQFHGISVFDLSTSLIERENSKNKNGPFWKSPFETGCFTHRNDDPVFAF